MDPNDHFVDAGVLCIAVRRQRTWRERLFSRPWTPLVAWDVTYKPIGHTLGPITWTPVDGLIALANATLPDTDPGKLGQGDIDAIGRALANLMDEYGIRTDDDPEFPHQATIIRDLRAVARKLAALLPPDGA